MDFQKVIDFLADDWNKFVERATKAYEEGLDIALDQWDTFKKLDSKYQGAIIGGAAFIVLVIFLAIAFRSKPVPVVANLATTQVLGGSFIAIENESLERIPSIILVLDDEYIYRLDELASLQETKIYLKDFHYLVGELQEGEKVENDDFTPYKMKVICPLGEKEIELTKKKGWFR
jgi:hypothetical protein